MRSNFRGARVLLAVVALTTTAFNCGRGFGIPWDVIPPETQTAPAPTLRSLQATQPNVATRQGTTATIQNTSTTLHVKLYFVALNDNGKSGKLVGCGDSLVAVDRDIPHSASPLTDTLTALFAVKTQYYGQSGLYNALYQSNLRVEGVSAHNGVFRINLVGKTQLGGVCDDPRFIGQIRETALQFPTVKQADIYVNGISVEKLLSGTGM